jgi:hypothetical protein
MSKYTLLMSCLNYNICDIKMVPHPLTMLIIEAMEPNTMMNPILRSLARRVQVHGDVQVLTVAAQASLGPSPLSVHGDAQGFAMDSLPTPLGPSPLADHCNAFTMAAWATLGLLHFSIHCSAQRIQSGYSGGAPRSVTIVSPP